MAIPGVRAVLLFAAECCCPHREARGEAKAGYTALAESKLGSSLLPGLLGPKTRMKMELLALHNFKFSGPVLGSRIPLTIFGEPSVALFRSSLGLAFHDRRSDWLPQDLLLMTATLGLCALAPTARRAGGVFSQMADTITNILREQKYLIESIPEFLESGYINCVSHPDFVRNSCLHGMRVSELSEAVQELVSSVLQNVGELADSLAMEPRLLMAVGLCVLTFWAASALLVKAVLPKAAVPSSLVPVNSGIGGPIYILSGLDEIHVKKAVPKIFQLLVLRTFLFTAFLAGAWRKAEVHDARLLFALIFNRLTTPSQLRTLWLVACLLHLASGYVAVCAIEMSHRVKRMKSGRDSAAKAAEAYGTFPATFPSGLLDPQVPQTSTTKPTGADAAFPATPPELLPNPHVQPPSATRHGDAQGASAATAPPRPSQQQVQNGSTTKPVEVDGTVAATPAYSEP